MKHILFSLMVVSSFFWATGASAQHDDLHKKSEHHHGEDHDHEHDHESDEIHAQKTPMKDDRRDSFGGVGEFANGLSDIQIAVIDVNGMVCDFCARGLERTFKKDEHVRKVDIDLKHGKVLVAYSLEKQIDREDLHKKIRANGQTMTDLKIVKH